MTRIEPIAALIAVALLCPATIARGQDSGASAPGTSPSPPGSDQGSGGDPTRIPGAASSGWGRWYMPYYTVRATPDGRVVPTYHFPFGAPPPVVVITPASRPAPTLPPPPPALVRPVPATPTRVVKKADRERAELLTTYGDRMFRVGNLKRAEDRYEQAAKLNPFSATPRARLSQVALVRGRYAQAADYLREAETAEPGWIADAKDVQSLYAEPADFARHVAKLEAHLHKDPLDRDAWLVLGAQWFLSRREGRGADVFRRLDDPSRRPDVALAAFLEAARIREPEPKAPRPAPGRDQFQPPDDQDPQQP